VWDINLKIDFLKKSDNPAKSLRAKLLGIFIAFSLILLALLWIFQSVLLEKYYEHAMLRKCQNGVKIITDAYSKNEDLAYEEFCTILGNVTSDNDFYVYIESEDGSFSLSSADVDQPGRVIPESKKIFSDAKNMLINSFSDEVSYTIEGQHRDKRIVFAKEVDSETRGPIFLYAIAFLAPLGPAVGILRSQLIWVTIMVLIAGAVLAALYSKHLAAPMAQMSRDAKRLGEGDFDVHFDGGDYIEMNELADALNNAAAELKTTDSLRKDLLANVSHDLRTPLTMIKSYAEMIRDISGDNAAKREEHLGVIIEESDRLSALVNEILELSKVQSGAEVFKNRPFDIQKAAEEIVQTYKIMESEGYTIDFERTEENILVLGDESKIKQVISNLMSNAVKYCEERKEVKVAFKKEGDHIKLSVSDRGIGIPEDQLEKIWTRYQRASQRAARSKDGSGLGLSISGEILKRSGAEYGVESKLGEGSTFWFSMKIMPETKA